MGSRLRLFAVAIGVTVGAALAGCGGKGEPVPPLHPLSGTVERDGKPVTGGGLFFAPDPATNTPLNVSGPVQPDGTFAVETMWSTPDGKTHTRTGAPAGKYKVIYHPPSDGSKAGLEQTVADPVTVAPGATAAKLVLPAEAPKGAGMERDDVPKK